MENSNIYASVDRQKPIRTNFNSKSSLSGRNGPKNSGSIKRLSSGSTRYTRRESKGSIGKFQRLRTNQVVLGLSIIAVWCYIGFHVQSKWAHNDNGLPKFLGHKPQSDSKNQEEIIIQAAIEKNSTIASLEEKDLDANKIMMLTLATEEKKVEPNVSYSKPYNLEQNLGSNVVNIETLETKKKGAESNVPDSDLHNKKKLKRSKKAVVEKDPNSEFEDGLVPRKNTSYGLIVGPFSQTEDAILEWNSDKRRGTCDREGEFAKIVFSRSFVLVFHELSITGAPLSMMELASELLSCGAKVSAVVVNRKGGLLTELQKRGIKVVKDRLEASFKAAMKADAVIAGSAVCSTWIDQYLSHHPTKADKIIWWIMENRREYFDRSMHLLGRVKMLAFLSDSQSKRWISWCEEEKIKLNSQPVSVPLSVNEELAFVAGIPTSLNTDQFSTEKMVEKRNILRNIVRQEMGLGVDDVMVMSLSSINPGKGQRLLLEAAILIVEDKVKLRDELSHLPLLNQSMETVSGKNSTLLQGTEDKEMLLVTSRTKSRNLIQDAEVNSTTQNQTNNEVLYSIINHSEGRDISTSAIKRTRRRLRGRKHLRGLLAEKKDNKVQNLRVLIGSLGSKSTKVPYLRLISRLITQHSNMSKLVMWTPATTHVLSLYAAADIYVMNAQGIGETFGRVTIEAMAFGLPVLGTDAGGTKEIVEHGVTGLLHPVGRNGTQTLAENMLFLLRNPDARVKMGNKGRELVISKYLKSSTYNKLAQVLAECMRT
ncbi:UDP-Glycosyltransferase superfamily protein [Rhynchospora pubera]|uniref:UDP-Glycosyltransferase superfamily protein n=1 Tax=Rhynchospora pubera TaxID=906938 RepID=A0AAV8HUQ3_9POAL|nr:UDP-Glycosyltransferase superfamily protein [Rhynchospora pubera]